MNRSVLLGISLIAALTVTSLPHSTASREVQLSLVDSFGTSRYRVVLDLSPQPTIGDELKVVFMLYLDELPPFKHYSGYVSITFSLVSEDGRTLARRSVNNRMEPYRVDYIYPGYRWGPYTIAVNPDYSRLTAGNKAKLYLTLESEEYVEDPLGIPVIATRPNPVTAEVMALTFSQPFPLLESVAAALIVATLTSVFIYMKRTRVRRRSD